LTLEPGCGSSLSRPETAERALRKANENLTLASAYLAQAEGSLHHKK
jgi:hypothetical protein